MRKMIAMLSLTTLLVLLASQTQAQFGGGFGRNTGGYTLLINKSVQEEIKLSAEQKEKLDETMKTLQPKITEQFKDLGFGGFGRGKGKGEGEKKIDPDAIAKSMAKMAEIGKSVNEMVMKEVKPILKEEQYTRFMQISRQQMKLGLFADADYIKEVGLSDSQATKIKKIVTEAEADRREIQTAQFKRELTREEGAKKLKAIEDEVTADILADYSDEQKSKHKSLLGEPFEVKFEMPNFGKGGFNKKGRDTDKDK